MLYDCIKKLSRQKRLNLKDLAQITGISYETIKNWGRHAKIAERDLLTIAQFFDVSADYLIGNSSDPQSHKSDSTKIVETLQDIRSIVDYKISEAQKSSIDSSIEMIEEPFEDKK